MIKYNKEPWHDTSKKLPSYGGARCICYMPMFKTELEMIFHFGHNGYKASFREVAKGGRVYDYDFIKYWKYYND